MICPACSYKNRDDHRFCTQCGMRLDITSPYRGRLTIVSEPGRSNDQRRQIQTPVILERREGVEVCQATLFIGRHADNAFVINDDQASTHHARIISEGPYFHIEDLSSTNGTYVDGSRINTPVRLRTESLIKIGSTIIKFEYLPFPADK